MKNLFDFFNNTLPLSEEALKLMSEIFVYDELKKGEYFVKKGQYAKDYLTYLILAGVTIAI